MRVLLKISGEALAGDKDGGLDSTMLSKVGNMVKDLVLEGNEIAIVIGAGNFIRGAEIEQINIDRANADNMGMLAISINSLALSDVLLKNDINNVVYNSFGIDGVVERFNKQKAIADLENKKVVICSGGTGNPYFTTDTAGVLRAIELESDLMIKATKVDGVYDSDPVVNTDAKFIKNASYDEVISKGLRVMDMTSIALAKENKMTLKVVSLYKDGAIKNAINSDLEGTKIS